MATSQEFLMGRESRKGRRKGKRKNRAKTWPRHQNIAQIQVYNNILSYIYLKGQKSLSVVFNVVHFNEFGT